jgi:Antitoxin SocA-like, Panacea domain
MVLIKLLYWTDRTALIRRGLPVTGDKMVSMPHGPVLSGILDLINMGADEDCHPWFEYISEPETYDVRLTRTDPETDELSRWELGLLDEIDGRLGHLNKWALRTLSHELPEWEDPHGSSFPIDPAVILRAEGRSTEEIERVSENAEELRFFQRLESLRA